MSTTGNSTPIPGDNPIEDPAKDVLERSVRAADFARQVLELDASHGTTVGVFGPWGSGKTSFVNLARVTFEEKGALVLDFNPWLFSGAEQLVERFFAELSASMGMTDELKEIGDAFGKYGAALNAVAGVASALLAVPQIGAIVTKLAEAASSASQPKSVDTLRKTLADELQKHDKRIVVVLDDIDRLSAPEIREVFKLVRLTASFPNLIYIVSCDRWRVEQALDEKGQGLSGRDYLEKIIQWSFNLPEIPGHLLKQQLFEAIENALAGIQNPGPFDQDVWGEVYRGILRPLIRNMRDVRRFAMAIRETVGGLEGQVAQTDVLALEAVRVFLPDVFRLLPGAIDGLAVTSRPLERELDRMRPQDFSDPSPAFNERRKARVNGLIEAAEKDREREADPTAKEVVEAMIYRLFPAGARLRRMSNGDSESHANEDAAEHLRERRVAHEHVLRLYLERVVSPDLLAFHEAEQALDRMTDRDGLNEFIRSLESARWQDVVSNLCELADRFRPEHMEPGIVVLLNLWPDMPERPSGSSVLGNDTRSIVRRTTYRLLRSLDDTVAVEAAMRRILPEVTSLSSKMELVLLVGHRKKSEHKLVSETVAHDLENMLRHEIRAASADELAEERDPLRVLVFATHYGGPTGEPFEIDDSPKLTFALLRSTRWETATASTGALTVTLSPALGPETLVELYGGQGVLETRINDLKSRFDTLKPWFETRRIPLDEAAQLLDLADQYLSGSRPDED